jgi:hypothetical protein
MSTEEKPTIQLPAVPDWAIELAKSVKSGFKETNANIELVATDLTIVKERVAVLEKSHAALDERIGRTSNRARQASESDLEHEAALATEVARRQELERKLEATHATVIAIETKTDIQTEMMRAAFASVAAFANTPRVKIAGGIIFGILCGWAARYGIHIPLTP